MLRRDYPAEYRKLVPIQPSVSNNKTQTEKENGAMAEVSQEEKAQDRRAETLLAIKFLTKALLSDEDLSKHRIVQQLTQIGKAIIDSGITDEEISRIITEVRQEMHVVEDDVPNRLRVPFIKQIQHAEGPEVLAMRVKDTSHVIGGHALASKVSG